MPDAAPSRSHPAPFVESPGPYLVVARSGSRNQSGSDVIESMFPDAGAREAVRALFGLGFDPITLKDGRLTALRSGKAEVLPRMPCASLLSTWP